MEPGLASGIVGFRGRGSRRAKGKTRWRPHEKRRVLLGWARSLRLRLGRKAAPSISGPLQTGKTCCSCNDNDAMNLCKTAAAERCVLDWGPCQECGLAV